MPEHLTNILAAFTEQNFASLRLAGMFAVLISGLTSGYLAANRFGVPERWSKTIMTAVLVSFGWMIALLVIWQMHLDKQLIWLPTVGALVMLTVTAVSMVIFPAKKYPRKSRQTLILAAALSNLGYTGGAFICYALFGTVGLAMANIYLVFFYPIIYLAFFPWIKVSQLKDTTCTGRLKISAVLDIRLVALPAVIIATVLNIANVKVPRFISDFHIVDIMVYTASALSFFAIGLMVNFSRLKNYIRLYFQLFAIKFILTPAVAVLFIFLLALAGQDLNDLFKKVIIVLAVSPSAVFMVTMTNVFDLDAPLAGAIWVVTTAVFIAAVVPVLFIIFT
jgi:predicted permease